MSTRASHDAVVIGAGPAGAALAIRLARAGFHVLLLERNRIDSCRKVLRGEWIAPWGVEHLQVLGLYERLVSHGQVVARHIRRDHTQRNEDVLDLSDLVPGVPGPLGIEYGRLCGILRDEALNAGVRLIDDIRVIDISPGARSRIRFERGGREKTAVAPLVIGADGRSSAVRKKLGVPVGRGPLHHYICGLLLDGVSDWPSDAEWNAVGKTAMTMVIPVGNARVRAYIYFDPATFRAIGTHCFAEACRAALRTMAAPGPMFADGHMVGTCLAMQNAATWTDTSYRDGVVLIGDAAGSDDPITGQGLSLAFRDARLISDILIEARDWGRPDLFRAYGEAKAECLRRLRFTSGAVALRDAEFGEGSRRRRTVLRERLAEDPARGLGLLSQYIGPDRLPGAAFSAEAWRDLFGDIVPPPDFISSQANHRHAESLCV